jgi:two-component system, chemotaxis family, response regulator Rcp1
MNRAVRILLVEDNPADVELARETLAHGKLHLELTAVSDGVQALEALRGAKGQPMPDLILLDLNLPRKDGREVLREIKSDDHLRRIPVVVLTSSDADTDILRSYDLGANCYVTKPLDLRAFQAIVQAVEDFWFTIVRLPPDRDVESR